MYSTDLKGLLQHRLKADIQYYVSGHNFQHVLGEFHTIILAKISLRFTDMTRFWIPQPKLKCLEVCTKILLGINVV